MKKLFFFLSLSLLICASAEAYVIQGTQKSIETERYRINGRYYIPLRLVCEANGFDWDWEPASGQVNIKKGDIEIKLLIGSKVILVNGDKKRLNAPLELFQGGVLVPASFSRDLVRWQKIAGRQTPKPKRRESKRAGYEPSRREKASLKKEPFYKIKKIVIDPGHGGKDPGAIGISGIYEKHLVLDVSKKLAKILEKNGIDVTLTRETDEFISLWNRSNIANSKKADFFISIHANASRSKKLCGFEVYYLSEATDDSARALASAENTSVKFEPSSIDRPTKDLEAILWDLSYTENRQESIDMARYIISSARKELREKKCRLKSARFYVLGNVEVPGVLVEIGYISNRADEKKLKESDYKQELAEALAMGVLAYKNEFERTNGFTE